MKFSNGCWLQKEGCACFSPAEVYFTKIEKDKVVLCAPTHKINHRGDTLGGINLTVEITTPMPEVIRVKTYHYKGAIQDGPVLFGNNQFCISAFYNNLLIIFGGINCCLFGKI